MKSNYIKCYKKLYFKEKTFLNEEEKPCDTCLELLKCYELEKVIKTIGKERKKLKSGETKIIKLILGNQYLNDIEITKE